MLAALRPLLAAQCPAAVLHLCQAALDVGFVYLFIWFVQDVQFMCLLKGGMLPAHLKEQVCVF